MNIQYKVSRFRPQSRDFSEENFQATRADERPAGPRSSAAKAVRAKQRCAMIERDEENLSASLHRSAVGNVQGDKLTAGFPYAFLECVDSRIYSVGCRGRRKNSETSGTTSAYHPTMTLIICTRSRQKRGNRGLPKENCSQPPPS